MFIDISLVDPRHIINIIYQFQHPIVCVSDEANYIDEADKVDHLDDDGHGGLNALIKGECIHKDGD